MEKDDQKLKDLKLVFGESVEFIVRESSGGKYISLTVKEMMLCADDIFNRYREVSKFKGIISL
jgi:putative lipoic acid-binding regulatory protein